MNNPIPHPHAPADPITPPAPDAPVVGITCDIDGPRVVGRLTYIHAVLRAGAHPIFLPPIPELAPDHARRCHAIVFSGGDDPLMEEFGEPTHPNARPVDPRRQRYELQLLTELERNHPKTPVLGVCLGMQYMALHAGGRLNQHMPDDIPTHETHRDDKPHNVRPIVDPSPIPAGIVTSHHRQAVSDPGALRTIAIAEDEIIEAIDDPNRSFYIGVQWHPERTESFALGQSLYNNLIKAI